MASTLLPPTPSPAPGRTRTFKHLLDSHPKPRCPGVWTFQTFTSISQLAKLDKHGHFAHSDVSEGSGQSSCETEEEEHSVSDQQVHSYDHGEAGHPHVRTRQGCCCSRMSASGHRHRRRKGHPNRPQPHSCLSKGRNKGRKEGMGGDPAGCPQGPKPLPQRNSRVPPNRELA